MQKIQKPEMIPFGNGLVASVSPKAVKRVNMSVKPPHGELRVSCPRGMLRSELVAILEDRSGWFEEARARVQRQHRASAKVEAAIEAGQSLDQLAFLYLGETWLLKVVVGTGRVRSASVVREDARVLELRVGPAKAEDPREHVKWLERFYKDALVEALPGPLMHWQSRLGVEASDIRFRKMSSRWGSCQTHTKVITINTRLAQYDLKYFEQVLLHELVHLRVPNHGEDFYHLMDRHLPAWKRLRAELKRMPF